MDVTSIALGVGIGVGVAALGVAIGQGLAANAGLQAMARQPEVAGKISTSLLISLVFIELVFLLTFALLFTVGGKLPGLSAEQAVQAAQSAGGFLLSLR